MFQEISPAMVERMEYLEALDYQDRRDGTPRLQRLRQITPDTGRFLALMAAGAPEGDIVEVGTSAGYSTMWLSLACRELGRQVTTYEVLPEKAALARETFRQAGIEEFVNLVEGDARTSGLARPDCVLLPGRGERSLRRVLRAGRPTAGERRLADRR